MLSIAKDLGFTDDAGRKHCLAVLACMNADTIVEAAELADLDEQFVIDAMQPLVEQGIYKDGRWAIDPDIDVKNDQDAAVQITLWVLCSQKLVIATEERVE